MTARPSSAIHNQINQKNMSNKNKTATVAAPQPSGENGESIPYRENAEVNFKIDTWIASNPKRWGYIQGMTLERAQRSLALREMQDVERVQRFRQRVMKQIERDPQRKQAFEQLVKDLPAEDREFGMVRLATEAQRLKSRSQSQGQEMAVSN
jgi:hypothetical protein